MRQYDYNDHERLEYLIMNAYSGLNSDLTKPFAVGLVIGGKVEWPDSVREMIDRQLDENK
ncbi:MAG: hypothetical protein NUV80_07400 [Candidatus Berkelbacteria bacterium]|nr:hypothetical protein [Candidatus Berkelbacteria bacterium]